MLDTGADRDVISEAVVKDLDIETTTTEMRVITVDNEIVSKGSMASFTIESLDGSYSASVSGALVGNLLTSETDLPPYRRNIEDQPHLKDIKFDEVKGATIDIIIGAGHFEASVPEEVKKTNDSSLLAYRCAWG